MKKTKKFLFFYSNKEIYSQWYKCSFIHNGQEYNCAEQAMMAEKAKLFNDHSSFLKIINSSNPKEQKELGRQIKSFNQNVWDQKKEKIIYEINYSKFNQNEKLKQELLDTNILILVEASPTDKIWGIGLDENDPRAEDIDKWQGLNLLGEAIMTVRYNLQKSSLQK